MTLNTITQRLLKPSTIILAILIAILAGFFLHERNRANVLAKEIESKSQEYARIASEKITYERSCAIAKEKEQQLLLLHGQAERLRAERALVLAEQGKEVGTR